VIVIKKVLTVSRVWPAIDRPLSSAHDLPDNRPTLFGGMWSLEWVDYSEWLILMGQHDLLPRLSAADKLKQLSLRFRNGNMHSRLPVRRAC
jgi:hypothetical protein